MRIWERMKAKGWGLLAAVLLGVCLAGTALAASYPFTGVVNDDTNMRSAPKSTEANVIRRIAEGETVEVIGESGNFYRIQFDGKTGYVFKKYVERSSASGSTGNGGSSAGAYQTVTTDAVNLRASASTSGKKLTTIPAGATVSVNRVQGDWVNVTYGGQTGWCYKAYVRLQDQPAATLPPVVTAAPSTGVGYLLLQNGANSDHVMALQEALIELGFLRGTADGVYGSATAQAVMALQRANDYPITGTADAILQAFIFNGKPVDARGNKAAIKTLPVIDGINIRYGDRGVLVRRVQSRLETLGYLKDNVTGTYDRETEAAVKQYQQVNGLKADGVCGEDTQALLFGNGGLGAGATASPAPAATPTPLPTFQVPTATVRNGSKGENARLVQERLIELGYLAGSADGKFGSKSVAALKAFQTKNNLTADGVAGAGTYEVLFSWVALGVDYVPLATPDPLPTTVISDTYPPITKENVVVIKQGVSGVAVRNLERRLTELGYYQSGEDGECRADDVAAIRAFQRNNGLDVDGVAGYDTQSAMYAQTAIMNNGQMVGGAQASYTTLKKGMSGQAVMDLQLRLISLGYMTSNADGVYGTDTAEAVYNFQKANGLVRDGVAGEKTLRAIYSVNAAKPTPAPTAVITLPPAAVEDALIKQGDSGSLVKMLQQRLIDLGYLTGSADGVFGSKTYRALKNFQKAHALMVDGIAGSATFAALNMAGTGNNGSNTGGNTGNAPTVTDQPGTGMGTSVAVTAKNVVYEYWYSTVRAACRKYPYATVYDYQTGISWQVHMFSYGKHAEAEPLTAEDTRKMEQACGGNKWTPRPVWVIFADGTIRIATTHSVPHEVQHITDNDFPGHTCIHFPRTMAQVTAIGPYATSHQNAVDKAWAQTQAMAK